MATLPKTIMALIVGLTFAPGAAKALEPGFKLLFNGKDLSGWDGDPRLWSVKEGVIVGKTTPGSPAKANTFLIWTNGLANDFELRFSYRIIPNPETGYGNSGVQYRSRILDRATWSVGGYQADIEAGPNWTGILYEERGRGILARRGQAVTVKTSEQDPAKHKVEVAGSLGDAAELQKEIRPGEWNDYVVIARGNHHINIINGRVMMMMIDEDAPRRADSGVIALQLHAGDPMHVEFRDIHIRELE